MLEFYVILFVFLSALILLFHEQGHKIVAGPYWQRYEFKLPFAILCKADVNAMPARHFLFYVLAGFIWSSPIVLIGAFVLSRPLFIFLLLVWLTSASVDFVTYYYNLLALVVNKKTGCLDKTIGELRAMK